jgi:uncharacterized iron-regulated protein
MTRSALVLPLVLLLGSGCAPFESRVGDAAAVEGDACATVGQWIEPATGERAAGDRLLRDAARGPVVLLGETHPNVEHHRWQLAAIAGLHAQEPNMVLGFEAFPRTVQPVLDRWVAGELDEATFLKEADWSGNWGFDPVLYLPMFHFARLNRVPMIALNVERPFVSRVAEEGLEAIPEAERQGLTTPAPASAAYLESLEAVFREHAGHRQASEAEGEAAGEAAGEADEPEVAEDPRFQRFTRVQLTWDRAMAEAVAAARAREERPLVVGIIGSGHLEYGHGVPHQLADLGIEDARVLLPVAPDPGCAGLEPTLADAVFVLPEVEAAADDRPRLGVMIETTDAGVRVLQVGEDSVAATADMEAGDVIVEAAGVPVADTGGLIEVVQRQAPGTWLPLTLERDGRTVETVAKFPPRQGENGDGE